jgi:TatA/E family protein of Tat protein translocase
MSSTFIPLLAFLGPETWIILVVAGGVLIFGADKLPKLARSAGQAKKEFLVGERARRSAQARRGAGRGGSTRARRGARTHRHHHSPPTLTGTDVRRPRR